jgi:hypothetical protein
MHHAWEAFENQHSWRCSNLPWRGLHGIARVIFTALGASLVTMTFELQGVMSCDSFILSMSKCHSTQLLLSGHSIFVIGLGIESEWRRNLAEIFEYSPVWPVAFGPLTAPSVD